MKKEKSMTKDEMDEFTNKFMKHNADKLGLTVDEYFARQDRKLKEHNEKTQNDMNLMYPFKSSTRHIGDSLYMLIPAKIRRHLNIPLESKFVITTSMTKFEPVKQRILQGFKDSKSIIKLELLNGQIYTGYVGELSQSNVTMRPEDPEAPTTDDNRCGTTPLLMVKCIHYKGEVIQL